MEIIRPLEGEGACIQIVNFVPFYSDYFFIITGIIQNYFSVKETVHSFFSGKGGFCFLLSIMSSFLYVADIIGSFICSLYRGIISRFSFTSPKAVQECSTV